MDRQQRRATQYRQAMLGIHRHLIALSCADPLKHLFRMQVFLGHEFRLLQRAR